MSARLVLFSCPRPVVRWPTSATAIKKSSRQKRKAHGNKEKLTAKKKSSRQKRKAHSKKRKAHGKREKLTAKKKSSRQKRKARGGSKNSWWGLWLSLVFGVLHAVYNQFIQRDIHYCSLSVWSCFFPHVAKRTTRGIKLCSNQCCKELY